MFGSILIMFLLPWIDRCKVRSGDFRPRFKPLFWLFIANAIVLGYIGSQPAEGIYIIIGRICTSIYFGYFVALWLISKNEKTLKLPQSISQAVLAKNATAHH
jgi:ubiquinol-cytochrome c reductase cytochrome b subunit